MDMKKSKYLYARAEATLINDDDQTDSICIPVELLRGARYGSANLLILDIGNPKQYAPTDALDTGSANLLILDIGNPKQYAPTDALDTGSIILEVASNTHTTVFESLSKAIAVGEKELIIIGDDVTGEYLNGVVSVVSVTVSIA